ncbi:hypothetical protein BGZ94_008712, partial [Podila epigama]
VTFSEKLEAIPAAVVAGVAVGVTIGYLLYRGGNGMHLQSFFVGSTCLLLLVAAGLVSKGIAAFEADAWMRATGAATDDDATFDPRINVWALKCCDPKKPDAGWWAMFNAILGWSNIASYFTIFGYCAYWGIIIYTLWRLRAKRVQNIIEKLSKQNMEAEEEAADEEDGGLEGSRYNTAQSSSRVGERNSLNEVTPLLTGNL